MAVVGHDRARSRPGAGQFDVTGDTTVGISVAALSGGSTKVVAGPDSALPRAVQFPAYVGSGTYPRAVVRLAQTSGDALSPGSSDFEYGAVFRLNPLSSGRSVDNGNNVFQRGLYADRAQFKLQIDHGYPSCLVKGSAGRVFARSSVKVTPDTWYSARALARLAGDRGGDAYGAATTVSQGGQRLAGTLTFGSSVRASIGGKLSIVRSPRFTRPTSSTGPWRGSGSTGSRWSHRPTRRRSPMPSQLHRARLHLQRGRVDRPQKSTPSPTPGISATAPTRHGRDGDSTPTPPQPHGP